MEAAQGWGRMRNAGVCGVLGKGNTNFRREGGEGAEESKLSAGQGFVHSAGTQRILWDGHSPAPSWNLDFTAG